MGMHERAGMGIPKGTLLNFVISSTGWPSPPPDRREGQAWVIRREGWSPLCCFRGGGEVHAGEGVANSKQKEDLHQL